MCGIAGAISRTAPIDAHAGCWAAMSEAIARRGPDQSGSWFDTRCALLHRRLAVVDPEGGRQPMSYDQLTLVYNGELYNTPELRQELLELGYEFDGHSDTEVVLKAVHAWGAAAPERFNGIFAYAVYDSRTQALSFARDPMGVKPFFYAVRDGLFLFASELKGLLAHPAVEPVVTREGLYDVLFLGPGRTPGCGVFKDVFELLPGQQGVFDRDGLRLHTYWALQDGDCTDTFEQAAEKTEWLVTDAIRRQLVSDVPLCTFLSGGLDSSIISAVTRETNGQVKTYSVDYRDNDRYFRAGKFQPNSDNAYIGIMQEFLQSAHTRVELDTAELVMALFEAADARDLPGMADVDASMLLLSRTVRRNYTVVLSGECADEIFGGYPWYRDPDIRAAYGFPWAQTTDYRATFVNPDLLQEETPVQYVRRRYEDTLAAVDKQPGLSPLESRMKEMMVLNLRWFMQTLLDRKDRMSMYSGLEIRVPFCDRRIVEYLYTLPWEYKDYHGREKGLLRHAMARHLPPEIVERKKSPYPKTWNPDYKKAVSALLRRELEDPSSPLLQYFDRAALLRLTVEDRSIPWYGQLMTTPQTIAYFLQIAFWMRKFNIVIE